MSENKISGGKMIPRRGFLGTAFLAVTGLAAFGPNTLWSMDSERSSQKVPTPVDKESYFIIAPEITVGNLSLTPIMLEHSEKDWKLYGEKLKASIQGFPIIIPEYFPHEYQRLMDNPIMGVPLSLYKGTNAVFSHLEEELLAEKKELWVVDPSYSEASVVYRLIANIPLSLFVGKSSLEIEKMLRERIKKIMKTDLPKGLSFFINLVQAFLITSTAEIEVGMRNPYEQESRRAFTAQALIQLGAMVQPNSRAAIIYPYEHWRDIQKFLEDDTRRKKIVAGYRDTFNANPIFADFFKMRHYTAEGNGWNQGVVTSSLKPSMRE